MTEDDAVPEFLAAATFKAAHHLAINTSILLIKGVLYVGKGSTV